MQPSLSDGSSIIGEDSSYFLCTCGAEFELLHRYERHLREKHQLRTSITSDKHTKKQEPLKKLTNKTQQPSGKLNDEVKPIEDSGKNKIASQNRQMRSKEERRRAIKTLSKAQSSKESSNFNEKKVTWQGLKLVKNKYCHIEPYYCGYCQIIIFEMEDYITHCIDACQTLIHKDSSHTITLNLKEEATQENHSDIEDLNSNIQQSSNLQQIAKQQEFAYKPFKQILLNGLDHKTIPFYCGHCRINISRLCCQRHIKQKHGQKIHQNSSHIIVKCFYNSKIRLLYLSPNVPWITQEKKYFCLCNPEQKLKMEYFIQHIKKDHSGISPLYVLQTHSQMKSFQISKYQRRQNANLRSMNEKTFSPMHVMPQSHIKQLLSFRNVYDIFHKRQDHRNIPFSCGYCTATFKIPFSYKRHLQNHHNEGWGVSNSHVVLQLQNGKDKQNLYLCPSIKWHHDQLIYFCPCSIDSKVSMSSLLQHVITEHNGISPLYYQQTRINRNQIMNNQYCIIGDSMRSLRKNAVDNTNVPFSCYPCNLRLKNGYQYRIHMRDVHSNTIHPCSSHIIFLFKRYRYRQRTMLLISPHVKWTNNEHSDYYCSCEPERKITMETLIQHIIRSHHGITPEYCFQERIISNQYFITQKNSKAKEFDGTKQEK